jgi:hypothetical protein
MAQSRRITVIWRAFENSIAVGKNATVESDLDDFDLCEEVYAATNLYQGQIWEALQPLPEDRSHTALSVISDRGDYVIIDNAVYEVAAFGFRKVA